ncbi:lipoprotein-anchoring transpeptidase ErfK/SrfK [Devosia sp. UYZn731]|uniref:L,D-transpeptidase n=1 Tax=Devosia sp. UYZn731 TaxID=3156345 RepID=UPI0033959617
MINVSLGRRQFLASAASLSALALAGCATTTPPRLVEVVEPRHAVPADVAMMYGPLVDEGYSLRAADMTLVDPLYWRQQVVDPTGEKPGTVVVDTANRFLYHVGDAGMATRYGVGIGRDGFAWAGRAHIAYKKKWPTWTPPSEMIDRQPELEQYRHGMEPGIGNPLGARAMYIHQGQVDTIYRIHGNPDETSIGKAVSSGCVRLLQQDVIHLADSVKTGSILVVM